MIARDKEQWKELWIGKQAKDRGAIESAINVKSGKIEGAMDEEASDGSGSKRMSDGCYNRSNRRSNGSADGSGSKGWIKEKFEGAMDQGE